MTDSSSTSTTGTAPAAGPPHRASWAPMVALALAQVLMSFNVAALPVSLGGMVQDFGVPPTTVSTGIVTYGLVVAALVMTGAKLGQRFGWVRVFRIVIAVFILAMVLMTIAPNVGVVITAQALAGAAAAIIVPSLVALIAENYEGDQQATAVGSLGSARAASGVSAFVIGGLLGTFIGWRPVFAILIALAVVVFVLSFRLRSDAGNPRVKIDLVGAVLIGLAVVGITLGFNNMNGWGFFRATSGAPFDVAGVSPAPLVVVVGIVLGQAFFVWTRHRARTGKVPLINLSVIGSSRERSAITALFVIVAIEAAVNFSVPLYIQIVQGRTPLDTSLAMLPFNLTVFVSALVVVRFYARFSVRAIACSGFVLSTVALLWLAFVVTNDWETLPTILGLIVFGAGQGALVTVLFNVLVTSSPKQLAGDVGSVRGTAQNLASAVGTALVGVLLVTLLSTGVTQAISREAALTPELQSQVDLDDINFTSNDDLRAALAETDATPAQVDAAVRINTDVRLRTLRIGFLVLAALSALAILPSSRLPRLEPGTIPERAANGDGSAQPTGSL
ncbi:MFS transporter [Curtobacterium sp. PhB115]|uniref:MFS transporter n=1 Tax=Curtobacterium sp. PhB115 TaxID=2485173 RepID=UPI000FAF6E9E|nr:MFS transporter [Curtobacterium sp. PhB115]ROP65417.1 putative MFS family arabinose efflux permease [Curtobacterium sp. PhB115]